MMMKNDMAVHALNQLVTRLTPADRAYVGDLRAYLNGRSLFGNAAAVTSAVTAMVQDLLEAEAEGETAQTLLGDSPQGMARELLSNLPRPRLRDHLIPISVMMAFSWIFLLLSGGARIDARGLTISAAAFLILPLVLCLALAAAFQLLAASVYAKNPRLRKQRAIAGLMVLGVGACGVLLWLGVWPPQWWRLTVPTGWSVVLIVTAVLVYVGLQLWLAHGTWTRLVPSLGLVVLMGWFISWRLLSATNPPILYPLVGGVVTAMLLVAFAAAAVVARRGTRQA
ncbi:hypothetical protein [Lacticaseibacillus kribbianus]|uniref:hypothetical protein n=1 Tax=Lacticaseibacillus kribbianus TaxID=2926292 RepID=UPI001CD74505|nr:hypothetical protein [Lacticaseibacillus kribbianus]